MLPGRQRQMLTVVVASVLASLVVAGLVTVHRSTVERAIDQSTVSSAEVRELSDSTPVRPAPWLPFVVALALVTLVAAWVRRALPAAEDVCTGFVTRQRWWARLVGAPPRPRSPLAPLRP